MRVEHCIARAKYLDISTDKIASVKIYDVRNNEVTLPKKLHDLVCRRMNKNRITNSFWNADILSPDIRVTIASDGGYIAIAMKSMVDKHSKAIGSRIAIGRLNRALGLLDRPDYGSKLPPFIDFI